MDFAKTKKGLYHNLEVSSAGVWDLLEITTAFSSKHAGCFLFVRGAKFFLGGH